VVVDPHPDEGVIHIRVTVRASDRTGVEMESLTGAAVAALSLYDTAKAFDRAAVIGDLKLVAKRGGKSGDFTAG
jgi:cyclic pyranopterin phosphate synthase